MSLTQPPRYPECCPKCLQRSGLPFSAGTCERPDIITVKLRCQACGHEWTADAPKAPMSSVTLWHKRSDRRRNVV